MIIFVNGPFGVGKTTAVSSLHERMPDALVLDPEKVGHMLWGQLPAALRREEFELEPLWPGLTRMLVQEAGREYARTVLVPMTIARRPVFEQIIGPLRAEGPPIAHFTLLASPATIRTRLRRRGERPDRWGELSWEGLQVERCLESLTQPEFATHIDTERLSPEQVADEILRLIGPQHHASHAGPDGVGAM